MAAPLQQRPARHVVYLGTDAAGIAAELAEPASTVSSIATGDDGEVIGWMIGDVDDEMGRVWWFGPFVDADGWAPIADELLAHARQQLASTVTEEEIAVDDRFERFAPWATAHGFEAETASWVLTLERELAAPSPRADREIRAMTDRDHDAVARLHDAAFPGTHTPGARLVEQHDADHPRLVAVADDEVVGYIAVERQPEGSGYVDFVAVDPAHRRRGLAGDLVRAGVQALVALEVSGVHLTVRESADGARELYASLGFTEERLARPYRKGFSIG